MAKTKKVIEKIVNEQIIEVEKEPEPVVNILENIVYIEPRTDLPIPDGMCINCNS